MSSRPNATDVAGRLLALRCVVTYALATPARDSLEEWFTQWTEAERKDFVQKSESQAKVYWDTVKASPIFNYLSPQEWAFADTTILTMSSQQHIDAMWRAEAARVFMWALMLIAELPAPDIQATDDLLKSEPLSRPVDFLAAAALRPKSEIDRARDIAELWHWRAPTEQLIRDERPFPADEIFIKQGIRSYQDIVSAAANHAHEQGGVHLVIAGDFAVKGKPCADLTYEEWSEVQSISIERHRALNWLCGYSPNNDWDSTPTET